MEEHWAQRFVDIDTFLGKPLSLLAREANQLVLSELELFNRGKVEAEMTIMGRVGVCEGTVIPKGCCVRSPEIIGKNCEIGAGTYIGRYTSIVDNVVIDGGEIENTIVLDNSIIQCGKQIVDSLIGTNSKIVLRIQICLKDKS